MKLKKITYPKIKTDKTYQKKCPICNKKFKTQSYNTKYCDNCKADVYREKNNKRVQKYNKMFKKNNKLGTGKFLCETVPAPPDKELENILREMYHFQLL